jgi:hypothetical protein
MSPSDIHANVKEEEAGRLQNKHQQEQEELSAKAYELFSEAKTPVQVAITLNLREPEETKYYREYWKLNRLHTLNSLYKEIGNDIRHILELHRRAKEEDITIEQDVNLLQLADEDNDIGLSSLEKRCKLCIDEIHDLDIQIKRSMNHLQSVNDETASAKTLLNSYHLSCERKRQEAENLNSEISRLDTLVSRFKNNNEEYLKIQQTAKNKVTTVLRDNKQILQFALAAGIGALRRNPHKYNNLLAYNTSSTAVPGQQLPLSSATEGYNGMILDEAKRLYDILLKHLTKSIVDNAAELEFILSIKSA